MTKENRRKNKQTKLAQPNEQRQTKLNKQTQKNKAGKKAAQTGVRIYSTLAVFDRCVARAGRVCGDPTSPTTKQNNNHNKNTNKRTQKEEEEKNNIFVDNNNVDRNQ